MDTREILAKLEKAGNPDTKRVFMNHGAREPFWGVKTADIDKIAKPIKTDHNLALELYASGNSDAKVLAGKIVDPLKMTVKDLNLWVDGADWYMLSEYTVAGVAAESPNALKMARKWMKSEKELIASAGWSTYASYLSLEHEEPLNLEEIRSLLKGIETGIHNAQNRVRYCMNNFVICVGSYVPELLKEAKRVAEKIGKVTVDMGKTSCKVPFATDYIGKIEKMGRVGKKRKNARC